MNETIKNILAEHGITDQVTFSDDETCMQMYTALMQTNIDSVTIENGKISINYTYED